MKINVRFVLVAAAIGLLAGSIVALASFDFQFRLGTTQASSSSNFESTPAAITVNSDAQQILALMNHSHKQWNSVSLTMLSTAIHNGTAHEAKAVYQIAPSGRAYVYSEGDGKSELWISDGRSWLQERSTDNTYTVLRISSQKQEELRDFVAPTTVDSMTFPHPFGSLIPVQGAELLYPTGIAQSLLRNGKITVVGNDTVANRDTVVVQRENFADDGTLIKKHLYWVDAETGVILQAQIFNPGSADQWQVQHTVVEISFDVPLPTETFDLVPKLPNSRYIPPEEFYDLEELP